MPKIIRECSGFAASEFGMFIFQEATVNRVFSFRSFGLSDFYSVHRSGKTIAIGPHIFPLCVVQQVCL